jgi:surfeit locus 1 family protein
MTADRPAWPWGATVLTAIMLPVLLALGFWQLERRVWKAEVINQLVANEAAAPDALPDAISAGDVFTRVTFGCRWQGRPLLLPGSGPDGKAGERLYQLCQPEAGGAPVLVDLGFVALGASAEGRPAGPLIGALRQWPKSTFVERISGARRVGPDSMTGDRDFFVQLEAPREPGAPEPAPLRAADLPNNHLSYAIQWFSFAAILMGIFLISVVRRGKH